MKNQTRIINIKKMFLFKFKENVREGMMNLIHVKGWGERRWGGRGLTQVDSPVIFTQPRLHLGF